MTDNFTLHDPHSYFPSAFTLLLNHERGKVTDHAGPTHNGVILRDLQALGLAGGGDIDGDGDVDVDDLWMMTEDDQRRLFYEPKWNLYRIGDITPMWPALKYYDCAINMGPRQAGLIMQRALRSVGEGERYRVVEDGVVGPKTRAMIEKVFDDGVGRWGYVSAVREGMAGVYRMIAQRTPARNKELPGWLNRAYDF